MEQTRTSGILLMLAAVLLLLAACDDGANQSSAAPAPPPPPEVGVVELQPQRVALSMKLPGRTAAYRIAEVRPQVTGILQERSEEHTSELQSLMRISYAVFCLKKKKTTYNIPPITY